jgi:hypothetical protein
MIVASLACSFAKQHRTTRTRRGGHSNGSSSLSGHFLPMSCKLRTRAASRSAEPVPCVWPASLAPETCARSRFDNAIYPPHFSPRRLLAVRSHGNDEERRFSSMISSFVACRLHICCTLIVECVFFLQAPNLLFSPLGSLLARQGSGRAA